MVLTQQDAEPDETSLLAELLEVSNRSTCARYDDGPKAARASDDTREGGSKGSSKLDDGENNNFHKSNPEDASLNQYWYSQRTIGAILRAATEGLSAIGGERIAFLSTPSLYFALPVEERKPHALFDFDKKWSDDEGFVQYDFNDPFNFDKDQCHTFDAVVIDPPFISMEVWKQYAKTALRLLKSDPSTTAHHRQRQEKEVRGHRGGSIVIATTVQENAHFMKELLGVSPVRFLPSIPNLVYQYTVFSNFSSHELSRENAELGE